MKIASVFISLALFPLAALATKNLGKIKKIKTVAADGHPDVNAKPHATYIDTNGDEIEDLSEDPVLDKAAA